MYARRTVFDLALPRLLADVPITGEWLAELGHGGLCLNEVMPIGAGTAGPGPSRDEALDIPRGEWPDLCPVDERRGNGPAHYYASAALAGRIGMIDAVSHKFCARCNRVRLTGTFPASP